MGEIGKNLSNTLYKILVRETTVENIEKVFIDFELKKDDFLEEFMDWSGLHAAIYRAQRKLKEEYCFVDIKILEEQDKEKYAEYETIIEQEKKKVAKEAEEILERLLDEGKIISTVKEIKKGEKITAIIVPGQEKNYPDSKDGCVEINGSEDMKKRNIICINGKYYAYPDPLVASLSLCVNEFKLFDDNIQLLANQMYNTKAEGYDIPINDRIFFLQQLFPEYRDEIEHIMNRYEKEGSLYIYEEDDIEYLLRESELRKKEHTAEEIGQGTANGLSKGEEDAVKKALIEAQEKEKKPKPAEEQDLN